MRAIGIFTLSGGCRDIEKLGALQNILRTAAMASLKEGSRLSYHAAVLARRRGRFWGLLPTALPAKRIRISLALFARWRGRTIAAAFRRRGARGSPGTSFRYPIHDAAHKLTERGESPRIGFEALSALARWLGSRDERSAGVDLEAAAARAPATDRDAAGADGPASNAGGLQQRGDAP